MTLKPIRWMTLLIYYNGKITLQPHDRSYLITLGRIIEEFNLRVHFLVVFVTSLLYYSLVPNAYMPSGLIIHLLSNNKY